MDNQLLTQQTLGAIVSILQIAIPIGFAFFGLYKAKIVDYINAKIATIKDSKTRELVKDAFDRVDNLLDTEISNIENTAKNQILKDIASGKVDKDSLKNLGVVVANSVTNQLSEKTTNILSQEVTDVQAYISSRLEKVLGDLKVNDSSSVSKTILPEVITPVIDTTELTNANIQLQSDKDNLISQVNQIVSDKFNIEQVNNQLTQEKEQLKAEKEVLQNKLNVINSAVNTANVSNNITVDAITVNSNDATSFVNGMANVINQTTTLQ